MVIYQFLVLGGNGKGTGIDELRVIVSVENPLSCGWVEQCPQHEFRAVLSEQNWVIRKEVHDRLSLGWGIVDRMILLWAMSEVCGGEA
jgi:hypothetical protein